MDVWVRVFPHAVPGQGRCLPKGGQASGSWERRDVGLKSTKPVTRWALVSVTGIASLALSGCSQQAPLGDVEDAAAPPDVAMLGGMDAHLAGHRTQHQDRGVGE